MEFRNFTSADVAQAAKLLADRHKRERLVFPTLKDKFESAESTEELIKGQLEEDIPVGLCAYEGERMLGYMMSRISDNSMLGRNAWVGYDGMAIAETESPELYRWMYAEISKVWLKYGALNHYVYVPAGYQSVLDAWLRLSFSYQQVFGIMSLQKSEVTLPDGIKIRQSTEADSKAMEDMSSLILPYQASSPTYGAVTPERMAEVKQGYGEIPLEDEMLTLIAEKDGKPVGFQCGVMEDDDSCMFVPKNSFEISISGTFKECRGMGVATALTKTMINEAIEQGFENTIVDWRIANLYSSNFWPGRGLKPAAYRMFRHIDESVYWANGDLSE